MHLSVGQTLCFYEILGPLGAGGMGEVYRAKDTRLGREVAIKVLPADFADDDEHLQRFEREAKSLASLNHPNVAQIHGVDQEEEICFLVLELVPGETLQARLENGPLAVEEAIDVCSQIAEGLEAAHEAGVIHRDLKPANVCITPEGRVKVLDFGLAKPIGVGAEEDSNSDSVLKTEQGQLLGTPTYMAPEQARGKAIDRRVDVWAFGCVLYECLTAQRAFAGETITDILAAVVHGEVDWSLLPDSTPVHVRQLVQRCLNKDPRRRLRDMGDAWVELTREGDGEVSDPVARGGTGLAQWLAYALASVTLGGGLRLGYLLMDTPGVEQPKVTHSALPLAPDLPWDLDAFSTDFAVSPDGEQVVYCGQIDQGPLGVVDVLVLWKRSQPESEVLWTAAPGLNLGSPFFSSESDWIGVQVTGDNSLYEIRRVSALGGEPQEFCSLPARMLGVCWAPEGTLYFGTEAGGIYKVREKGVPEVVTTPEPGVEWLHMSPNLLPGGEQMLYVIDYEGGEHDLALRSLTTGSQEILVPGARWARFLEPETLIYVLGEDLWADSFDPHANKLGGKPVQLTERIAKNISTPIDVSRDGTLVYSPPVQVAAKRSILWVNRDGSVEPSGLPVEQDYSHVSLSPDGDRAVFGFGDGPFGGTIRVWNLDRGHLEPPLLPELGKHPEWEANGEQVIWYGADGGIMFRAPAAGGSVPEQGGLFEAPPLGVLADSRVLHYRRAREGGTGLDLYLTPFDGDADTDRVPLLVTAGEQIYGALSRDEKWLAYATWHHAGTAQLFLSPVPTQGPGRQVSTEGGAAPRWNRDGDELFYSYKGQLSRVSVIERDGGLELSEPTLMHEGLTTTTSFPNRPFDITPDGQRALIIKDDAAVAEPELRLVTHLLEEVRAKMDTRD